MKTKYALIVFDYKLDCYNDNDNNINAIIEFLRLDTYRNKSIQISKNTLLIRVFDGENHYYDEPKYHIENAIGELIEKEKFCHDDITNLNYYCFPTDLIEIEKEIQEFEKEIKYLDGLKK